MRDNWWERAACIGTDPKLWWPIREGSSHLTEARAICARCPVSAECLDDVLSVPMFDASIRAGLTVNQRRGMKSGTKATRVRGVS